MKKLFYLIAIVGFVMVSCAKPNDNPNPNEEKTYSFSIGAEKESGGTDETRVEMVDGLMHWSVGDNVEIHIKNAGSIASPMDNILEGIPMTGLHREPARATTFAGKLTQTTISKLNPNNRYDYVTFYNGGPQRSIFGGGILEARHITGNNSASLEVSFRVPLHIAVSKNEFSIKNVIMIDHAINIPPMTWLENGTQKFGEKMTFTYKHVLAYLRVKIEENLSGKIINEITISSKYGSNARPAEYALSGYFTYRIYRSDNSFRVTGDSSITGLSSAITAHCSDVGGINSGDYVYIPIPQIIFYNTDYVYGLQFSFKYADGSRSPNKIVTLTTNGPKTLEAGKVYDIAFKLP